MSIMKKKSFPFKIFTIHLVLVFVLSMLPVHAFAQSYSVPLPPVGTMVSPSAGFNPLIIRGLKIDPANPFEFDFLIEPGDQNLVGEELKEESTRLIKYFLASLTVPEKDLWVNLSPYEKDRIIPEQFGQTEMGRELLAQDYLLKQLTASLMHPDEESGAKFWETIRQKTGVDVPVNTFNKVWIVPEHAEVFEGDGAAFVTESRLRVMLEEDYLAMQESVQSSEFRVQSKNTEHRTQNAEILQEIIIPEIEHEVNHGEHFAPLRQIYYSLILASWYKRKLKNSVLSQVYADQNKTEGVTHNEERAAERIYDQYVQSFRKGVYDFIEEEYDPVTQQIVPRKYFSGGLTMAFDNASLTVVDKNNESRYGALKETIAGIAAAAGLWVVGTNLMMPGDADSDPSTLFVTETQYQYEQLVTITSDPLFSGSEGHVFEHPDDATKLVKVYDPQLMGIDGDITQEHMDAYRRIYEMFKRDSFLSDQIINMEFVRVNVNGVSSWGIVTENMDNGGFDNLPLFSGTYGDALKKRALQVLDPIGMTLLVTQMDRSLVVQEDSSALDSQTIEFWQRVIDSFIYTVGIDDVNSEEPFEFIETNKGNVYKIYLGNVYVGEFAFDVNNVFGERVIIEQKFELHSDFRGQGISTQLLDELKYYFEEYYPDKSVVILSDVYNLPSLLQMTVALPQEYQNSVQSLIKKYKEDLGEDFENDIKGALEDYEEDILNLRMNIVQAYREGFEIPPEVLREVKNIRRVLHFSNNVRIRIEDDDIVIMSAWRNPPPLEENEYLISSEQDASSMAFIQKLGAQRTIDNVLNNMKVASNYILEPVQHDGIYRIKYGNDEIGVYSFIIWSTDENRVMVHQGLSIDAQEDLEVKGMDATVNHRGQGIPQQIIQSLRGLFPKRELVVRENVYSVPTLVQLVEMLPQDDVDDYVRTLISRYKSLLGDDLNKDLSLRQFRMETDNKVRLRDFIIEHIAFYKSRLDQVRQTKSAKRLQGFSENVDIEVINGELHFIATRPSITDASILAHSARQDADPRSFTTGQWQKMINALLGGIKIGSPDGNREYAVAYDPFDKRFNIKDGEKPVGYFMYPVQSRSIDELRITQIFSINKDYQGEGISTRVLEQVKLFFDQNFPEINVTIVSNVYNLPTLLQMTMGLPEVYRRDVYGLVEIYQNLFGEDFKGGDAEGSFLSNGRMPDVRRLKRNIVFAYEEGRRIDPNIVFKTKNARRLRYFSDNIRLKVGDMDQILLLASKFPVDPGPSEYVISKVDSAGLTEMGRDAGIFIQRASKAAATGLLAANLLMPQDVEGRMEEQAPPVSAEVIEMQLGDLQVIDQIVQTGIVSDQNMDALIGYLNHENPAIRMNAAQALAAVGYDRPDVVTALRGLLNDVDQGVRGQTATTLSYIVINPTDQLIEEVYTLSENQKLRWEVLEALERMGQGNQLALEKLVDLAQYRVLNSTLSRDLQDFYVGDIDATKALEILIGHLQSSPKAFRYSDWHLAVDNIGKNNPLTVTFLETYLNLKHNSYDEEDIRSLIAWHKFQNNPVMPEQDQGYVADVEAVQVSPMMIDDIDILIDPRDNEIYLSDNTLSYESEGGYVYPFFSAFQFSNSNVFTLSFEDVWEQKVLDRIGLFVEHPEVKETILPLSLMPHFYNRIDKRYLYDGHDYHGDKLAEFFNLAKQNNYRLSDKEKRLRDFLMSESLRLLYINDNGNYEAKDGLVITSFYRDISYDLKKDVLTHEVYSHAMYMSNPDYANEVRNIYNSLSMEQQGLVRAFLAVQGYDIEDNEELLLMEFAAYFQDPQTLVEILDRKYTQGIGGDHRGTELQREAWQLIKQQYQQDGHAFMFQGTVRAKLNNDILLMLETMGSPLAELGEDIRTGVYYQEESKSYALEQGDTTTLHAEEGVLPEEKPQSNLVSNVNKMVGGVPIIRTYGFQKDNMARSDILNSTDFFLSGTDVKQMLIDMANNMGVADGFTIGSEGEQYYVMASDPMTGEMSLSEEAFEELRGDLASWARQGRSLRVVGVDANGNQQEIEKDPNFVTNYLTNLLVDITRSAWGVYFEDFDFMYVNRDGIVEETQAERNRNPSAAKEQFRTRVRSDKQYPRGMFSYSTEDWIPWIERVLNAYHQGRLQVSKSEEAGAFDSVQWNVLTELWDANADVEDVYTRMADTVYDYFKRMGMQSGLLVGDDFHRSFLKDKYDPTEIASPSEYLKGLLDHIKGANREARLNFKKIEVTDESQDAGLRFLRKGDNIILKSDEESPFIQETDQAGLKDQSSDELSETISAVTPEQILHDIDLNQFDFDWNSRRFRFYQDQFSAEYIGEGKYNQIFRVGKYVMRISKSSDHRNLDVAFDMMARINRGPAYYGSTVTDDGYLILLVDFIEQSSHVSNMGKNSFTTLKIESAVNNLIDDLVENRIYIKDLFKRGNVKFVDGEKAGALRAMVPDSELAIRVHDKDVSNSDLYDMYARYYKRQRLRNLLFGSNRITQHLREKSAKLKAVEKQGVADGAGLNVQQATPVGGIDLNPANWELKMRGQGGTDCRSGATEGCLQFDIAPQDLERLRLQIDGLVPVIMNIQPVQNLPLFLGMQDDFPEPDPVFNVAHDMLFTKPELVYSN